MINPEWLSDLHDGLNFMYYPSGKLCMKAGYSNNVLHGDYEIYYQNGRLCEKGTFDRGVECGPWEWHDYEDGLTMKGFWENGELKEQQTIKKAKVKNRMQEE